MIRSPSRRPSRRGFLAGLGLGAAYLPLLPPVRARAACLPVGPKRLVIVAWPNGVLSWPAGASETDFSLPAYMKDLEPYKKDLLFVDKLRFQNQRDSPNPDGVDHVSGHASNGVLLTGKKALKIYRPGYLTSIGGGPSIDQHVAAGLRAQGFGGLPSLTLGVLNNRGSTVWRAAGQPVPTDNDPYHVFDTLFGGGALPGSTLEKIRRMRGSVLDLVGRDLDRFGKTLGSDERHKAAAHVESIREIERQLAASAGKNGGKAGPACPAPVLAGARVDVTSVVNFPQITRLQMDLAVAALASDLTRVVVLQLGHDANHHIVPTWLGAAFKKEMHDVAHSGPNDQKVRIDQWYHEQFAYLVGKLAAEKEGDKSMLDSAAVLFANNMGNGANHTTSSVPWMIAGSCHGYFRTGRAIVGNTPQNGVLVGLANAMGVRTEVFGDEEYGGEIGKLRG